MGTSQVLLYRMLMRMMVEMERERERERKLYLHYFLVPCILQRNVIIMIKRCYHLRSNHCSGVTLFISVHCCQLLRPSLDDTTSAQLRSTPCKSV